jgi:hypothetical protein
LQEGLVSVEIGIGVIQPLGPIFVYPVHVL